MTLSHRIEGAPDGLPVVMIHPLGSDGRFWDECRRHFGPDIRTISCDLRGSGASPDLQEPLTLERTVADIEALRRHLGLDGIVVMGCAVGAMAAALYAARYPQHIAALIMSNPGFRIAPAGQANLLERAELVRRSGMAALLPAAIENAFIGYGDTEARRHYEERFLRQKPENYAFAALGAAEADISGCARSILCPVLLTPGRNDLLFGPAHAAAVAELIRQAEVIEFAAGAHFIPYQQPQEFGAAVALFLDRHGLRRHL